MSIDKKDIWNPGFYQHSPIFDPIKSFGQTYNSFLNWPALDDLKAQFQSAGLRIMPVPQADKPQTFEEHYEPRIYLKNELQTREDNWHDFFNAMVWLTFPETKTTLNKLHYFEAQHRPPGSNRGQLENAITLFDECGIIIFSDKPELLECIRKHEWQELFIKHRGNFPAHIQCIVFGHAIYEKSLDPYIGMTCQALLIESDPIIQENQEQEIAEIDTLVAGLWAGGKIKSTCDLFPFPVLGVPGWYKDNEKASFYENSDYFRPLSKSYIKL